MNQLTIEIKESPEVAPNYSEEDGWHRATLQKCVIVKNGTVEGNPTIDLQFEDEDGKKYVAMVTSRLLQTATSVTS